MYYIVKTPIDETRQPIRTELALYEGKPLIFTTEIEAYTYLSEREQHGQSLTYVYNNYSYLLDVISDDDLENHAFLTTTETPEEYTRIDTYKLDKTLLNEYNSKTQQFYFIQYLNSDYCVYSTILGHDIIMQYCVHNILKQLPTHYLWSTLDDHLIYYKRLTKRKEDQYP